MSVKVKRVNVSTRGSFEGWNLIEWIKGNWKTIKEVVKVGAPLLLSLQFFAENPVLLSVVTILGKGILDAAEYYFSEVEIKK